jgi:hypothetical protein
LGLICWAVWHLKAPISTQQVLGESKHLKLRIFKPRLFFGVWAIRVCWFSRQV